MKNREVLRRGFAVFMAAATIFTGMNPGRAVFAADGADAGGAEKVLDYSFEGNLEDSSGKGNNGTAVGTVSYADDGVNGTKALHLGGSGYVTMGTSGDLQPKKLSTSFWLRAPKGGLVGEQLIVWNKATGAVDGDAWRKDGWYMGSHDDGAPLELSAGYSDGQPLKIQVKGNRKEFFPEGEWVHIVLTYDSDTQKMQVYRNGVEQETTVAETTGDGIIKATNDIKHLGTNSWPNNYASYDIDEFEIYSGCLSKEEAVKLYNEQGGVVDHAALLAGDKEALTLDAEVTGDIALPDKGEKGGSSITWKSSDPAHITDEGKVTRPAIGEKDVRVTMTATLTNGDVTDTKEIEVTVVALNAMMGLSFYEKEAVEVTDAYYDKALDLDVKNLLALDADRLLAGFRETAAYAYKSKNGEFPEGKTVEELMKNSTRYGGGWENSLIGGHTMGHYLTAVAQGIVNPGVSAEDKKALTERLNYLVSALKTCQDQTKGTDYEGYLFGATLPGAGFKADVDLQFDNVEVGKANIGTQAWVPWYTMHKIIAGLTDAYALAGNADALAVANGLATWVEKRANAWSAATQNTVLGIEYGGMNDCLYELYKVNAVLAAAKDEKAAANYENFKEAAHKFDEDRLFESVVKGGTNVLNGKHANTTIPKFLGALCRYETDNSQSKYLDYAKAFWQMVVEKHTYITGGNSEDEHFGADEILDGERTNCNNETCNTYNMLKLSRRLFVITGEKKYADYYERTLVNAIMASQDHESGLTMYFQPMDTGYHKVFSTLDGNFWCCTGSGMENFTKLQDSIYFHGNGLVVVNQYLASKLTQEGYTIEQTGDLTKENVMKFAVKKVKDNGVDFDLRLRIPDWAAGDVTVAFGTEKYEYSTRDGYLVIPNDRIRDGAEFSVTLPMEVRAENLPDEKNAYAFKYGPYVLSAKLGKAKQSTGSHGVSVTVPTAKAVSSDDLGIIGEDSVEAFIKNINTWLVRDGENMSFTLNGTSDSYTFIPHFMQDESYGIYWTYYVDTNGKGAQAVLAEKNDARMDRTKVSEMAQAGRGQYENQFTDKDGKVFGLVDEKGDSIADTDNLTRAAAKGSSFGYYMAAAKGEDNYLYVTYAKEDAGKPVKIAVGSDVIFEGKLDPAKDKAANLTLAPADMDKYYQMAYRIPEDVVDKNTKEYEVQDGDQIVKKDILLVTFSGSAAEDSARICKSVLMMKAFADTNKITKITANGTELTGKNNTYAFVCPYGREPEITVELADSRGYVAIDGLAFDEKAGRKLTIPGGEASYTLTVYAENFEKVQEVTLKAAVDYTGIADTVKSNLVKAFAFDGKTDGAVAVAKADVPSPIEGAEYSYTEGKNGKAISLSGSYGLRLLENASVLGKNYTISFWMNPTSLGGQYDPIIAGGTFVPEYWLNLTCDAKIWSRNSTGWVDNTPTGAYVSGQWQQVTLTVDGGKAGKGAENVTGTLYLNGVKIQEGDIAGDIMIKDKAQLYVGVNKWDALFKGAVDDIMLFNKTLSETEVGGICANAITPYALGAEADKVDYTAPDVAKMLGDDQNGNQNTDNDDKKEETSQDNTGKEETSQDDTNKEETMPGTIVSGNMTYAVSGKTLTLKKVKAAKKSVTIPAKVTYGGVTYKVTAIAKGAMKNNKKVTKITVGSSVKTIGDNAFAGCKKLAALVLGKSVKTIGKNVCKNCAKLKKITVKGNVTKVGKNAFSGVTKKTKFTIKAAKKNYNKMVKLFKKQGAKKAKFKRA